MEYEDYEEHDLSPQLMSQTSQSQYSGKRSQYLAMHIATTQSEAYNPDQDKQEVFEIRRSYAHLREELIKNSRELLKADSNKLSELIDEANAVFSHGNIISCYERFD